jgi:hypothetical protein
MNNRRHDKKSVDSLFLNRMRFSQLSREASIKDERHDPRSFTIADLVVPSPVICGLWSDARHTAVEVEIGSHSARHVERMHEDISEGNTYLIPIPSNIHVLSISYLSAGPDPHKARIR